MRIRSTSSKNIHTVEKLPSNWEFFFAPAIIGLPLVIKVSQVSRVVPARLNRYTRRFKAKAWEIHCQNAHARLSSQSQEVTRYRASYTSPHCACGYQAKK